MTDEPARFLCGFKIMCIKPVKILCGSEDCNGN